MAKRTTFNDAFLLSVRQDPSGLGERVANPQDRRSLDPPDPTYENARAVGLPCLGR